MLDFIARVRLLFDKDKDFRAELADILGFLPIKIELYKIAFSHSSSQYRSPKGGKRLNNERLEFLGDAILEAVISDLVFHHFENKREGFLTNTRSKLVQRSMLNELATEMGVDRLIRTGTRGQSHNSNIGGNAFEALIGAIYLDRGYRACKKFVEKQILRKFVNMDDVAHKEVNFKSKILEYCQKNRINCEFKLKNIDKSEANSPVFRSILDIEGVMVGEGKGYSKKESEQNACRDALLRMRRSQALVTQVFEAKEARTSTEAPIFVAVPKIDEIEEEIAKMSEAKTERRRQQRQRQKERREEQAADQQHDKSEAEKPQPQADKEKNAAKPQPSKQEGKAKDAPKAERNNRKETPAPAAAKPAPEEKKEKNENKANKPEPSGPVTDGQRNSRRRKPAPNADKGAEKPEAAKPADTKPVGAKEAEQTPPAVPEEQHVLPISLKSVPKKKETELVPKPLFMLSDLKKPAPAPVAAEAVKEETGEEAAPVAEKKPRRSRRKQKASDEAETQKTKKEEPVQSEDPNGNSAAPVGKSEEKVEKPASEKTEPALEEKAAPAPEDKASGAEDKASAPEKKARRATRRRKPASEKEATKDEADKKEVKEEAKEVQEETKEAKETKQPAKKTVKKAAKKPARKKQTPPEVPTLPFEPQE